MTPQNQSVDLNALNAMSLADFVAAIGDVFEKSPWIVESIAAKRPFKGVAALYEALKSAVAAAPNERILELIRAHPDLAGKAARLGTLTPDSTAEQISAGLHRLSENEYDAFHRFNETYKAKFGFPFIVCVRRHTKGSILKAFEKRLTHDVRTEHNTAVEEILRIAALRLDQRVTAPDTLPLNGRLSTHVLDTHSGKPAEGVAVILLELGVEGDHHVVTTATTNADGRTDAPLISGRPIPFGQYELRFAIGTYFAMQGVATADPAFLDVVPVRFGIANPEGHYHIPLLASPWSYTTYRGS
jgi:2-oxo-4-hydroxy-4-carboxy-5-ureidoimidazoline decarboxylase